MNILLYNSRPYHDRNEGLIMKKWNNEQLIEAVKTSNTFIEVSRKLGLTTYGANSKTIKKYIKILQLDTSHFLTIGEQLKIARTLIGHMTFAELFSVNNVDRKYIKKKIIDDQLIEYQCQVCGISEWNGQKLSLHLDHINGINNDNRLENLRFLCPNCHSLTESYCGKNKKEIPIQENNCIECNVKIRKHSTRCNSCAIINRGKEKTKIKWPSTALLISMVESIGYVGVGQQLGVSGSSVKKRIRNHPND